MGGGVEICAAAMTRFGKHLDRTARSLVEEAVRSALDEPGLAAGDIQAAFVGNAVSGLMDGQESVTRTGGGRSTRSTRRWT